MKEKFKPELPESYIKETVAREEAKQFQAEAAKDKLTYQELEKEKEKWPEKHLMNLSTYYTTISDKLDKFVKKYPHLSSENDAFSKFVTGRGEGDLRCQGWAGLYENGVEAYLGVKGVNDLVDDKAINKEERGIIGEIVHYTNCEGGSLDKMFDYMPFDRGLKMIDKIFSEVPKNRSNYFIEEVLNSFVRMNLTPVNADKFLSSPLVDKISSDLLLGVLDQRNAPPALIEKVLLQYGDKINFYKHAIVGKDSIFREFKDRDEQEQGAADKVMQQFFASLEDKKARGRVLDINDIREAISLMEDSLKNGVVPKNYDTALVKITNYLNEPLNVSYVKSVIEGVREQIADLEIEIEKRVGKKSSEKIKGRGLEFEAAVSGARKMFLDGELLAIIPMHARFSENPTNGDVVAWLESEEIDSDFIKGTQNRDTVYAIKRGLPNAKQLLEDHAWSTDRYLSILPPEVEKDGKIKVTNMSEEKPKVLNFEI